MKFGYILHFLFCKSPPMVSILKRNQTLHCAVHERRTEIQRPFPALSLRALNQQAILIYRQQFPNITYCMIRTPSACVGTAVSIYVGVHCLSRTGVSCSLQHKMLSVSTMVPKNRSPECTVISRICSQQLLFQFVGYYVTGIIKKAKCPGMAPRQTGE